MLRKNVLLAITVAIALCVSACTSNSEKIAPSPSVRLPSAEDNKIGAITASVSGRVVDFVTGQPVNDAVVRIGNSSSSTDQLGIYEILETPTGSQTITVTALDYQDYSNTIEIDDTSSVIPVILLVPQTIPSSVSGLLLTYSLTIHEDASNRLHMDLYVRNIKSESLTMLINNTLIDDYQNVYDLFDITSNLSVTDISGNALPVNFSKKVIMPEDWYLSFMDSVIHYDVIEIDVRGNKEVIIEYDIASSTEMWQGFGADENSLYDDPKDVWAGYLEWILYRPAEHADVTSAKLIMELPSGWKYATVHPCVGNEVDLGRLDYMYGDNVRWKNFQRSNLVFFEEGPFKLATRIVAGVKVQDVFSTQIAEQRSHEDHSTFFEYLCESIGPLPVHSVLTFLPRIDGNAIPYLRVYQAGPYGWCHGLMGEYFGTGGGIGTGYGRSLAQVQLWDFNSRDDEKSYSFQSPHGTVRYWLLHLLQIDSDDGKWLKGGLTTYYENMAVASRYGWDDIIERRFKPMYHYYLNDIAGPPEFDQMNFTNHSFVTYFKSALIFFYISEIIKDRSEGTKNLDEAVKLLYKDALEGKCVSRNSLIEALNRLTDYDFASVVDNYLCGHEKLDLDYWLK